MRAQVDNNVADNDANDNISPEIKPKSADTDVRLLSSKLTGSPLSAKLTPSSTANIEQLRMQLLDAVSRNDLSMMTSVRKKVIDAGLSLTDQCLRDPQNNETVLHTALIQDRWDVGKYLIQSAKDDRLLDDVFTVTGAAVRYVVHPNRLGVVLLAR
jgi:hypothetical protein